MQCGIFNFACITLEHESTNTVINQSSFKNLFHYIQLTSAQLGV